MKHPGDLQEQKMLPDALGCRGKSKSRCCWSPETQVVGSLSTRWNCGELVWQVLKPRKDTAAVRDTCSIKGEGKHLTSLFFLNPSLSPVLSAGQTRELGKRRLPGSTPIRTLREQEKGKEWIWRNRARPDSECYWKFNTDIAEMQSSSHMLKLALFCIWTTSSNILTEQFLLHSKDKFW